jgi:hypothetical protein
MFDDLYAYRVSMDAHMCTIADDKIRINKIMSLAISMRLDYRSATLDELAQLCVFALQIYYDGACPEECLEAKAREFSAWHLARLGHDSPEGQRE